MDNDDEFLAGLLAELPPGVIACVDRYAGMIRIGLRHADGVNSSRFYGELTGDDEE